MEIFSFYTIQNNTAVRGKPVAEQVKINLPDFSLPFRIHKNVLPYISGAIAFCLLLCVLSLYTGRRMKPVSFVLMTESDTILIDSAMKKFVIPAQPDDFDEAGNVSSMKISKKSSLTMPVTFAAYTVKKNDNISSISKAAGLTNISTLIAVNAISNVRSLQAGQKLQIPSIDGLFHTVKRNESLAVIAASYGVTVENLLDVNDLATTVIKTGTRLFIPNARLGNTDLKKALGELFICPLTVSWRLTSAYGARKDPFTGVNSFHTGMDMAAPMGSPIKVAMDGRVLYTGYNITYGNHVIISHDGAYQTLYAHMSAIHVKVNQRLAQGALIGLVGNTGYSTGPHLHFSVYRNGSLVNPASLIK